MEFIDSVIDSDDDLVSLGAFSMVEGAILYSSFAFLKHFQSAGKNKLMTVVRGINFSVRDENLHSLGGAYLYNTLREETGREGPVEKLREVALKLYEHECQIIDMIFEKGSIEGITPIQMKHFVASRVNLCLKNLGIDKVIDVKYNPIADWFYTGINAYQMNDFFTGIGNEYSRDWTKEEFKWKVEE